MELDEQPIKCVGCSPQRSSIQGWKELRLRILGVRFRYTKVQKAKYFYARYVEYRVILPA